MSYVCWKHSPEIILLNQVLTKHSSVEQRKHKTFPHILLRGEFRDDPVKTKLQILTLHRCLGLLAHAARSSKCFYKSTKFHLKGLLKCSAWYLSIYCVMDIFFSWRSCEQTISITLLNPGWHYLRLQHMNYLTMTGSSLELILGSCWVSLFRWRWHISPGPERIHFMT